MARWLEPESSSYDRYYRPSATARGVKGVRANSGRSYKAIVVREIQEAYTDEDLTYSEIADRFGVPYADVVDLVNFEDI